MNIIWVGMIIIAVGAAALNGQLAAVAKASTSSANDAVTLALSLVGGMTFWLGMMTILEKANVLPRLAALLQPIMRRLFPDVPAHHPAQRFMILNIAANMLGLANAATPFGIKAMQELNQLNKRPGTATNAMVLFLAINTSNVALLPTGMIVLRDSLGSQIPGAIIITTLLATSMSTFVGIVAAKLLAPLFQLPASEPPMQKDLSPSEEFPRVEQTPLSRSRPRELGVWMVLVCLVICLGYGFYALTATHGWVRSLRLVFEQWTLVLLILIFILYGVWRNIDVYDAVVTGGKEGFQTSLRIIPYLVAIIVAVGMFRASGAMDLFVTSLAPMTNLIGLPSEVLPHVLMRPLSGSGAFGIAAEIMRTYGPDSFIGNLVSTLQGSSETTFYILAVYYGAIGVKQTRHTLIACLTADATGVLAALGVCRWWFG